MTLTGGGTLALLILLALATVVATAALWNRIRHPMPRWVVRFALIFGCQLSACAVLAAIVNDGGQFYTSWAELFGATPGVSVQQLKGGAYDSAVAAQLARDHGHSIVVAIPVPDAGGTKAQMALVYLPPQYFMPEYSTRQFPVIELTDGYPGTPRSWVVSLKVEAVADAEIAAGRAVPFIAVMPTQNYLGHHDAECINAVRGAQVETTLTTNVRQVMERDFRVSHDPRSWSIMGYSTGGFCAINIALRHPDMFSSAVSISGNVVPYIDRATGSLFGRDLLAAHENDPLWRLTHLRPPDVSLLLANAKQDRQPLRQSLQMAGLARLPTHVDLLTLPHGGHTGAVFRALEPVGFDWISHVISSPLAPVLIVDGQVPAPLHRVVRPTGLVEAKGRTGGR